MPVLSFLFENSKDNQVMYTVETFRAKIAKENVIEKYVAFK